VKRGRAGLEQLNELVSVKELEALYAATGLWDAIGFVRVRNRKHLLEVIEKIGDHPIVLKTSSSIILNTYKDPNEYNPFG
jgi:DNA-binding Lrp family transcriptional regulator